MADVYSMGYSAEDLANFDWGSQPDLFSCGAREKQEEVPQDKYEVTFDWDSQAFDFNTNFQNSLNEELSSGTQDKYYDSQQPSDDVTATDSKSQTKEQKNAKKKKIKNDVYTLTGQAEIDPTSSVCSSIKTGGTVTIQGVGKSLTGVYLIKNKEVSLTSSGISCSIEVLKTGFEGKGVNGG